MGPTRPPPALLALRSRAEEDAEGALAAAIATRLRAEEAQRGLEERLRRAQQRLEAALAKRGVPQDAGSGQARERFRQRLSEATRHASREARAHEEGALAKAGEAEAEARRRHLEARREREALETLKARADAEARRVSERRAEDAASDLAIAARHGGRKG